MANEELPEHPSDAEAPEHPPVETPNSSRPAAAGRHDIVEDADPGYFWPEVDDLLTIDFSRELANLPQAGDYLMGVGTNGWDPSRIPLPPEMAEAAAKAAAAKEADGESVQGASVDPSTQAAETDLSADAVERVGAMAGTDGAADAAIESSEPTIVAEAVDKPAAAPQTETIPQPDAIPLFDARPIDDSRRPPSSPGLFDAAKTREAPGSADDAAAAASAGAPLLGDFPAPEMPPLFEGSLLGDEPKVPDDGQPVTVLFDDSNGIDPLLAPVPVSSPQNFDFFREATGNQVPGVGRSFGPTVSGSDDAFFGEQQRASIHVPTSGLAKTELVRDLIDRRLFTTIMAGSVAAVLGVVGWIAVGAGGGDDNRSEAVLGPDTTAVSTTTVTVDANAEPVDTILPPTTFALTTSTATNTTLPPTRRRPTTSSTAAPATTRPPATAAPTTAAPTTAAPTSAPTTAVPTTAAPTTAAPTTAAPTTAAPTTAAPTTAAPTTAAPTTTEKPAEPAAQP